MLFRVCLGTPWPGLGQHGRAWDINSGRGRFQVAISRPSTDHRPMAAALRHNPKVVLSYEAQWTSRPRTSNHFRFSMVLPACAAALSLTLHFPVDESLPALFL